MLADVPQHGRHLAVLDGQHVAGVTCHDAARLDLDRLRRRRRSGHHPLQKGRGFVADPFRIDVNARQWRVGQATQVLVVVDAEDGHFIGHPHKENFIQCVRSRELPNADILDGHRSALLVHYANISYRVGGQKLVIDPATERFLDSPEAAKLFKREYRRPWIIEEEV